MAPVEALCREAGVKRSGNTISSSSLVPDGAGEGAFYFVPRRTESAGPQGMCYGMPGRYTSTDGVRRSEGHKKAFSVK